MVDKSTCPLTHRTIYGPQRSCGCNLLRSGLSMHFAIAAHERNSDHEKTNYTIYTQQYHVTISHTQPRIGFYGMNKQESK